jgi:hypothetical protein
MMSEQLTQNLKMMSDEELKQHLKDLGVVLKIFYIHINLVEKNYVVLHVIII